MNNPWESELNETADPNKLTANLISNLTQSPEKLEKGTHPNPSQILLAEILKLISIEISQPLSSLDQVACNTAMGAANPQDLEALQTALHRLRRTTRDITRLSELAKKPGPEERPANVNMSLARTVAASQYAAGLHAVEISLEGTDGAGPPNVNDTLLDEILSRLVRDALRYARPGDQIFLSSARGHEGGAIVRVRRTSAPPKTFGLDLTVALAAANWAGGTIEINSEGSLLRLPPAG